MSNKTYILIIILLTAGIFAYISWSESRNIRGHQELESVTATYNTPQTVQRIKNILEEKEIPLMAEIDYAAAARGSTREIRPSVLLIFGKEAANSYLISKKPEIAAALPLKILVWEGNDSITRISFVKTALTAQRYKMQGEPMFDDLDSLLNDIAAQASAKEEANNINVITE